MRSTATRLLRLRARIPPEAWMSVSWECFVCVCVWVYVSGRDLCVGLITRPEECYWLWCAWVWSRSLNNETVLVQWGCRAIIKSTSTINWPHSTFPWTPITKLTTASCEMRVRKGANGHNIKTPWTQWTPRNDMTMYNVRINRFFKFLCSKMNVVHRDDRQNGV